MITATTSSMTAAVARVHLGTAPSSRQTAVRTNPGDTPLQADVTERRQQRTAVQLEGKPDRLQVDLNDRRNTQKTAQADSTVDPLQQSLVDRRQQQQAIRAGETPPPSSGRASGRGATLNILV